MSAVQCRYDVCLYNEPYDIAVSQVEHPRAQITNHVVLQRQTLVATQIYVPTRDPQQKLWTNLYKDMGRADPLLATL